MLPQFRYLDVHWVPCDYLLLSEERKKSFRSIKIVQGAHSKVVLFTTNSGAERTIPLDTNSSKEVRIGEYIPVDRIVIILLQRQIRDINNNFINDPEEQKVSRVHLIKQSIYKHFKK